MFLNQLQICLSEWIPLKTWLASWPEWLDVKTYWVFKCKRQQDKKDHVSIYLYIILCLKVVGTILQIERIEPFKEWMIQSKCDVCSISYGCCQFPWKWKIKRSSNNLYFHTHIFSLSIFPTHKIPVWTIVNRVPVPWYIWSPVCPTFMMFTGQDYISEKKVEQNNILSLFTKLTTETNNWSGRHWRIMMIF